MQSIQIQVTPAQKETIMLRMGENGFDNISTYLRVVTLQAQNFILTSEPSASQNATETLSFTLSPTEYIKVEKSFQKSKCTDLATYIIHIAQNAIVSVNIEVRSTGDLDTMLKRIAQSREQSKPRRLF